MNLLMDILFEYYSEGSGITLCYLNLYVKLPESDKVKIVDKLRYELQKKFPELIRKSYDYDDIVNALLNRAKAGKEDDVEFSVSMAFESLARLYALDNPNRAVLTKKYVVGRVDPDLEKVIRKLVDSSATLKDFIKGLRRSKVAFNLDFRRKHIRELYIRSLKDIVKYVS